MIPCLMLFYLGTDNWETELGSFRMQGMSSAIEREHLPQGGTTIMKLELTCCLQFGI